MNISDIWAKRHATSLYNNRPIRYREIDKKTRTAAKERVSKETPPQSLAFRHKVTKLREEMHQRRQEAIAQARRKK